MFHQPNVLTTEIFNLLNNVGLVSYWKSWFQPEDHQLIIHFLRTLRNCQLQHPVVIGKVLHNIMTRGKASPSYCFTGMPDQPGDVFTLSHREFFYCFALCSLKITESQILQWSGRSYVKNEIIFAWLSYRSTTVFASYKYNATGDAISGQPGTKCLVSPPKFVKIVIKFPAKLKHTVQPAFVAQARHRDSSRESSYDVIHYALWGCTYMLGLLRDDCRSHISC